MHLHVLSSGSDRNGYILTNEKETLLIECGVKLATVKKAIGYNMKSIVGCVLSHEHNDHAGYIESYLKAGILVITSEDTLKAKNVTNNKHFTRIVKPGRGYRAGNFQIIPFAAHHDVTCYGYHIHHPETGNIMFLTDSFMTEYMFEDLSHILIEANYSDEILERNIIKDPKIAPMRPRLLATHMEIHTTRDTILANDTSKLRNIVLLHLSNGNSNEDVFVQVIKEATGIPNVFAAVKDLIINLNAEPF
jgi:phosphoribosyl 1,2-cyclic phosphodiesterase